MRTRPLTVLKLGGSVLRGPSDLAAAVAEIGRQRAEGAGLVVVVSAFEGTTDRLLETAGALSELPDPAALALLVSTGELASVALLSIALRREGIEAVGLDAHALGLRTTGGVLEGRPVAFNGEAVERALGLGHVVVAPGFLGCDAEGRTTLLGRGASDLTALVLTELLGAERCRLVKDVPGVFDRDPAGDPQARRYEAVSWDDALHVGGGIVQERALVHARRHRLRFEVASWGSQTGTQVGPGPSRFAATPSVARPGRFAAMPA